MAQAKTGQDVLILFPVFARAAGRQKSSRSMVKVWRFFLCCACGRKNTTRPLTGWIGGASLE